MPQYPYQFSENYTQDKLVAGLTQLVSETVVLSAGTAYKRGMVLGRVTASGKLALSLSAAADGSQAPYGICVDDFDATAADSYGGVYVKGEFNQNALILGAGQTLAGIHDALRAAGIFLKPSVPA